MEDILEDAKLSWKAKGLYSALVLKSKTGSVTQLDLIEMSTDGKTSVSQGLKELANGGYLVQERIRLNGKFEGSRWILPKEVNLGRLERAQMRAMTHMMECHAYERLIRSLKPEWYEVDDKGLSYADNEECPLMAIQDMYAKADRAWRHGEDWVKALEEAGKDPRIPEWNHNLTLSPAENENAVVEW